MKEFDINSLEEVVRGYIASPKEIELTPLRVTILSHSRRYGSSEIGTVEFVPSREEVIVYSELQEYDEIMREIAKGITLNTIYGVSLYLAPKEERSSRGDIGEDI